jgi:hypothetical protein
MSLPTLFISPYISFHSKRLLQFLNFIRQPNSNPSWFVVSPLLPCSQGSHSSSYEEFCFLGCNAITANMALPSSGWRIRQVRNQHEVGSKQSNTLCSLPASCWLLAWLTCQPCRWMQNVPVKRQLTFSRWQALHSHCCENFTLNKIARDVILTAVHVITNTIIQSLLSLLKKMEIMNFKSVNSPT